MKLVSWTQIVVVVTLWVASPSGRAEVAFADADQPIEEIVVTGFSRDYLANKGQTSAVGLNLTQLETPAAISIISQDILQDQQVNNVDDALRNVAGVTKFKTGNGGEEKFSIRGFDASQSIYKDGARINNPLNVSNIPSTETANIERIEVLKGPSALLYGQGEPGGIINYITKRPEFERLGSIELLGGSHGFQKVEADYTAPIGTSDTWAFRVVGAYEDSESFRDEVERERQLVNPTINWKPNDRLNFVLGYEYIDDDYTNERGQVLELTNPSAAPEDFLFRYTDRIDVDDFFGVPGWNTQTQAESQRVYGIAEFQIIKAWRMEATYAWTENDKDNFDSSPGPLIAGSDLVTIGPRKSIGTGETQQFTFKNYFDFEDGLGWEHSLLASYTYEDAQSDSVSFRTDRTQTDGGAVFFNVATGRYSSNFTDTEAADPDFVRPSNGIGFVIRPRAPQRNDDRKEYGINVLDYIRMNEQWALLFGARYSDYTDNLGNRSDTDISVRGGVVYSPADNFSVYASYSEGYTPSAGLLDLNERTVDPELSTSYEIGAKWALRDERLLITATAYHVELEDIPFVVNPFDSAGLPTDPDDIRYGNVGGIESQGFELEVVGQLTPNWRVQGGYAYIDNEITRGGTGEFGSGFPEGNRQPGIAKHNFNLFTFYELGVGEGALGFGGGMFYQGDTYISTENRAEYDSWVSVDLAAYYKWRSWKAQLNMSNVTDKEYRLAQAGTTTDSFAAIRVGTGAPRTITASVAYEF